MYIEIKNNTSISKSEIPTVNFNILKNDLAKKFRTVQFFVNIEDEKNKLYWVLADDLKGKLYAASSFLEDSFESVTLINPALQMYEREVFENFGITPVGHPWLKPVRKIENYKFLKSDDMQTHEVAVGPVHAGIIEPGHFRFLCNSERINHLEIQLGYQHRGVEKMLKNCPQGCPNIQLAESICGDSTIAYALTFARAIEALSGIEVDKKSATIRQIALELERIAIHIGDLGAISEDIAYKMGSAVFGTTRTYVINTMLEICGNRFGKGLIKIGGVNFDIDKALNYKILSALNGVQKRVDKMINAVNNSASVLSRLEGTATLSKKHAVEIGMVGMAARASGVEIDARRFDNENFKIEVSEKGDVYSRFYQRYIEIKHSKEIIKSLLGQLSGEIPRELNIEKCHINLAPNSFVVSVVEAWRGELAHTVITDDKGKIAVYKIKDPSFNNWFGLALANRNGQISNFPVCNKSFDLSYCGFDL